MLHHPFTTKLPMSSSHFFLSSLWEAMWFKDQCFKSQVPFSFFLVLCALLGLTFVFSHLRETFSFYLWWYINPWPVVRFLFLSAIFLILSLFYAKAWGKIGTWEFAWYSVWFLFLNHRFLKFVHSLFSHFAEGLHVCVCVRECVCERVCVCFTCCFFVVVVLFCFWRKYWEMWT